MNNKKKLGYLVVAWLGLCLILLLAACATLQNTGPEAPAYRVTVVLAADSHVAEFLAALNDNPPVRVELERSHTVIVTLQDQQAFQLFRQNLLNASIPVQSISTQRINP